MREFRTYADLDINAWLEPAGRGGVRLVIEGPKMRPEAPTLFGIRTTE